MKVDNGGSKMKVTIELELDNVSYNAHHGPGSKRWARYGTMWSKEANDYVPKPNSEYKPLEEPALINSIVEIMRQGFYDWHSNGWLKLKIDGKAVRECCDTVEGEAHKSYCKSVAGPEASEA
jgi:threonyl-tRNA synthetase